MSETGGGGVPEGEITRKGEREGQKQQIPYGAYDARLPDQSEQEAPEEDESGQSDDDSPIDENYDDEDHDEIEWESELERQFEENSYKFIKKATLSIFEISKEGDLRVIVQNLGQPLEPKQSLSGKAELLKEIGQIICNDDFLIKMALSGKGLPAEGYLQFPQIYSKKGMKETNTNASKIVRDEFIEIKNQTYSLRQFFQEQGGKERAEDEQEMLIYWSNNLTAKNFNVLARTYIAEKRKSGKQNTYYNNFTNFRDYLVKTLMETPNSWTADEIASLYLKRRNLEFNKVLRQSVSRIIEYLQGLKK